MKTSTSRKTRAKPVSRPDELSKLIRQAALTLCPRGSIQVLANKAGVASETIRVAIRKGKFTVGLACAIEAAVGADVLSKEALCPEKFAAK